MLKQIKEAYRGLFVALFTVAVTLPGVVVLLAVVTKTAKFLFKVVLFVWG